MWYLEVGDGKYRGLLSYIQTHIPTYRHANTAAQSPLSANVWSEGILDGIPIAVKAELDVRGYKTTVGTAYRGALHGPAVTDTVGVARLRAAGPCGGWYR